MMTSLPSDRLLMLHTSNQHTLLLTRLRGSEGISQGFYFDLEGVTMDDDFRPEKILGESVTVQLNDVHWGTRFFNGIVQDAAVGPLDHRHRRAFSLVVVPWFASLKMVTNCRIFQHQSVPEIFAAVCKEKGFADYNLAALTGEYAALPYCVQYNETDYDFLIRILEEAGIYYSYQHTHDRHILTLGDQTSTLPKQERALQYVHRDGVSAHVYSFQVSQELRSVRFAQGDYYFMMPSAPLNTVSGKGGGNGTCFEHYQYPGWYKDSGVGEAKTSRQQAVAAWESQSILAKSYVTAVQPATCIALESPDDQALEQDYLVVSVLHEATDTSSVHANDHTQDRVQQTYQNQFVCLPETVDYVPPITIEKPLIHGTQTAFVAGPKKQEIYTDPYGQIKVQFHWDREGQYDENSSCWLRVMQWVSGPSWGSQFIPRVGDEVIVGFINGNPNEPIVLGSVYNNVTQEPYALPAHKAQSGLKTCTVDEKVGHALNLDETAGQEVLSLYNQNQMTVDVEHDWVHQVDGDEAIQIDGDQLIHVLKGNGSIKATEAHFVVGGSSLVLDGAGITAKPGGGKVKLLAQGVGGMHPVVRLGDKHKCPKSTSGISHKEGAVSAGSPVLKVNSKAAARQGDPSPCRIETDQVKEGVSSITADGKPIARLGNQMQHGGVLVAGSPNVVVGDMP